MPYSKEEQLFDEFLHACDKKYASKEEKHHKYKIFRESWSINEQGTGRYGVNMFADLTPDL